MILDSQGIQLYVGDPVLCYDYWGGIYVDKIKRFSEKSVILSNGCYCLLNYQSLYPPNRKPRINRLTRINNELYNELKKIITI